MEPSTFVVTGLADVDERRRRVLLDARPHACLHLPPLAAVLVGSLDSGVPNASGADGCTLAGRRLENAAARSDVGR